MPDLLKITLPILAIIIPSLGADAILPSPYGCAPDPHEGVREFDMTVTWILSGLSLAYWCIWAVCRRFKPGGRENSKYGQKKWLKKAGILPVERPLRQGVQ